MKSDFTIIENTVDAQLEYGTHYGCNYWQISREDIQALLER